MAEELYFLVKFDCHDDLVKFRDQLMRSLASPPSDMGASFTEGVVVWTTDDEISNPRLFLSVPAVSAAQEVGLVMQANSPLFVEDLPEDRALLYGAQSDWQ